MRLSKRQLRNLLRYGEVRFGDDERAKTEFKKKVHDFDKTLYKMEFQAKSILAYSNELDFSPAMLQALTKVYQCMKQANEALNKVGSEINNF